MQTHRHVNAHTHTHTRHTHTHRRLLCPSCFCISSHSNMSTLIHGHLGPVSHSQCNGLVSSEMYLRLGSRLATVVVTAQAATITSSKPQQTTTGTTRPPLPPPPPTATPPRAQSSSTHHHDNNNSGNKNSRRKLPPPATATRHESIIMCNAVWRGLYQLNCLSNEAARSLKHAGASLSFSASVNDTWLYVFYAANNLIQQSAIAVIVRNSRDTYITLNSTQDCECFRPESAAVRCRYATLPTEVEASPERGNLKTVSSTAE